MRKGLAISFLIFWSKEDQLVRLKKKNAKELISHVKINCLIKAQKNSNNNFEMNQDCIVVAFFSVNIK